MRDVGTAVDNVTARRGAPVVLCPLGNARGRQTHIHGSKLQQYQSARVRGLNRPTRRRRLPKIGAQSRWRFATLVG